MYGLGALDERGAGVEQVEAAALRVLLRLRARLRDDDGDLAPRGVRVGEPGGDQRALHAVAAGRRSARGARELGDAVGDADLAPAREHAVAEGGVADAARCG